MQRRGPLPRNWIAGPTRRTQAFPRSAPSSRHTLPVASDGPARKYGLSAPVSRRTVLGGLSLLPLVAVNGVPLAASADPADVVDAADTPYLYLSPHQAAVLDAATRRLVPGPEDAPRRDQSGGARSERGPLHRHHAFGVLLLAAEGARRRAVEQPRRRLPGLHGRLRPARPRPELRVATADRQPSQPVHHRHRAT